MSSCNSSNLFSLQELYENNIQQISKLYIPKANKSVKLLLRKKKC